MAGSTSLGLGLLPLPLVLALLFGGALLLVAYVLHSRRIADPILDLTLLALPTFRLSILGALLFRLGIGATPFLLPLLLQIGFGMSPFQSGLITFASAIGAIAMKFVAPPLLRRHGFRSVLVVNALISGAFVAMPAAFTPATPVSLLTGLLLISGFFRSLQFTSMNALAYADVPNPRISRATTLTSVFQQLSVSVGISVGAIVLEIATGGGEIAASAFAPAFLVVGALAMTSAIPFYLLARDAGDEMSGRRPLAPDPVTVMRERG
jgi:MFS family permease